MVTVILSTYNRSKVLQHAIKSVLWQTYEDFELLVIGDCCTDDSEEVAKSFKDDRLRWINLEANCGNQFGPNNHGREIAKSRYIAYHNHDDIWYPTHLSNLVKVMNTGVDVAHSLGVQKQAGGQRIVGMYRGEFNHDVCLASNIIMHTTEIGEKVGGWSNPWEISLPVDQDFIRKMFNVGAKFGCTRKLTSLKFPAINQNKFYQQVGDYDKEQREIVDKIETDPHFMEGQLIDLLYEGASSVLFNSSWHESPKGGFVNASRESRGLPFMERVTWE